MVSIPKIGTRLLPRVETPAGEIFRLGIATADCKRGELVYVQTRGEILVTIQQLRALGLCDSDGKIVQQSEGASDKRVGPWEMSE